MRPHSDYESNLGLDTYSQADIDDQPSQPTLTRAQRLAAERIMTARDRGLATGQGNRASRRSRAPAFLGEDEDEDGLEGEGLDGGLLSGIEVRRRRRQYDERPEDDDMEGDDVSRVPGVRPPTSHSRLLTLNPPTFFP